MSTNVPTLSPDSGLAADISVSDLGRIVGGEDISAPVAEKAVPVPVVPPVADPEPTEAVAAEPAVAEPEENLEAEVPAEKPQESDKPVKSKKDEGWVDKRLSTLAQKRREAESNLASERKTTEQLRRELEAFKAQPGPTTPAAVEPAKPAVAAGKPDLASFVAASKDGESYETAVERYQEAYADWRDTQRETKRQAEVQNQQKQTQQESFNKDWKAATEEHPDFEDVVSRVREIAPDGLQVAISQIQDPDGKALWPKLTVYLDDNPTELAALSAQFAKNPYGAAAQLGRIAASLSPGTTPTPVTRTQTPPRIAPKPPKVVGGTAAPGLVDLNDSKTSMDIAAREFTRLGL